VDTAAALGGGCTPSPARRAPVPREPWPSLVCHLLHERLRARHAGVTRLGEAGPLRFVPADHGLGQKWDSPGALEPWALSWMLMSWSADSSRPNRLTLTGVLTSGCSIRLA